MEKRINREIDEKEGLLQDIEISVDLKLVTLSPHKSTLINVRDYGLKYEDSKQPLFSGIRFTVEKGERVALSGKNGCGKSTLIKKILEKSGVKGSRLPVLEEGTCEVLSNIVVSYIGQDTSGLKGDISTFCREQGLDKSLFCSILRQLDFERTQFQKNIEEYSEGQKKKILLAQSLLTPAHLYIWDEPLNYIDIFSRMQIEKLLSEYKPTMLFVEHDVKFCEKLATKTLIIGS